MRNKARIIKSQGNSVTVARYVNGEFVTSTTKALIGRMNKTITNMKQLESFKQGLFLPDFDIDGGDFVYSASLGESYVVSGTHQESFRDKTISIVTNLLKCNHLLNVKRLDKVADNRGNLRNELVTVIEGVPCFMEEVTAELRQLDAGIHPDTEYRIYTSAAVDVKETDQITVSIRAQEKAFKVTVPDYVTFPKMLVLEVCSDVRK